MRKELRTKRKALGLTQFVLGRTSGIEPWKITQFETGRVELTEQEIERIRKVLAKRASELARMMAAA